MAERFGKIFTSRDKLTHEALNAAFLPIYAEIEALRATRADYEAQITLFNSEGIKRVSEAVKPLVDQIGSAIDGGLLVAQTDDLVAIVAGAEIDFQIPEASRVAFRPTPFLAITAPDVRDDWAVGRVLVYNDTTGLLKLEILYLNGSGAERTGWTISASAGVVEAVSEWFTQITAMRDQVSAWRDEVAQKWADVNAAGILIAGGPVSSINGTLFGAVTGVAMEANHYTKEAMDTALAARDTAISEKADAEATTTALGLKANSADVAASLAALEEKTAELTTNLVASGAIGAGKFVVLRSDGKVEVVTGSETALSLGTAVQVGDTNQETMDAKYNAATGKIAILRRANTIYTLVVGTVVGSVITLGTPITLGAAGINSGYGKIAWRTDGSKIAVAYGTSGTTSMNCYIVTVTGTTLAAGTVLNFSSDTASPTTQLLVWDSITDKVIAVTGYANVNVWTVTGTSMSFGTNASFGFNISGVAYSEASARVVGWDIQTTMSVRTGTISGTTVTMGATATNSPIASTPKYVAASATGELLIVGPLVSQGPYYACVAKYSGNTVSFSAAVKVSEIASNDALTVKVTYSPQDDKFVIAQTETSTRSGLHEGTRFYVASIVAGAPSLSEPALYPDAYSLTTLEFTGDGAAVVVARLTSKLGLEYEIAGRIQDGMFTMNSMGTLSSALPSGTTIWVMLSSVIIRFYTATNRFAVVETPASFTGNAHKWFGVADAAAADGETVAVKLKGAVAGGQTGLTIGASYYLASDGTTSANDNGRLAGVAVGATKLRLAA